MQQRMHTWCTLQRRHRRPLATTQKNEGATRHTFRRHSQGQERESPGYSCLVCVCVDTRARQVCRPQPRLHGPNHTVLPALQYTPGSNTPTRPTPTSGSSPNYCCCWPPAAWCTAGATSDCRLPLPALLPPLPPGTTLFATPAPLPPAACVPCCCCCGWCASGTTTWCGCCCGCGEDPSPAPTLLLLLLYAPGAWPKPAVLSGCCPKFGGTSTCCVGCCWPTAACCGLPCCCSSCCCCLAC